ncbi:hypothetical protein H8356DRAFT_1648617 [Neocallimastix lanati (nom. inval.)]|nr:hypothetical protein H8356DRAFT_1648617 [Neocallimastix sp. JGI-2020a]
MYKKNVKKRLFYFRDSYINCKTIIYNSKFLLTLFEWYFIYSSELNYYLFIGFFNFFFIFFLKK